MTLDDIRGRYARQIAEHAHVRSGRLKAALGTVPREHFVGPGPWTVVGAGPGASRQTPDADPIHLYADAAVALDESRNLYNGHPSTVIPWIDALDLAEGHRVFHLGGGAGYYTAIMAYAVGSTGRVVMAEVDEKLGEQARRNLSGTENVEVVVGDGGGYDPGPCDAILVNAGVTHPQRLWLDRLNENGKLVMPLTIGLPNPHLGKGATIRVTRQGTRFAAAFLAHPIVIFSCTSVRDAVAANALLQAYSSKFGSFREVRSLRMDAHEADPYCWVHTGRMCLSSLKA